MIQPKYSPEEALQRMKLMMEYDSSKTYTENKVIVENKQPINEIAPLVAWGIAAGLAALGIGGAASNWSSEDAETKVRELAGGCDKSGADAQKLKRETMDTQTQTKIAGLFRKAFDYTLFGMGVGAGTDEAVVEAALAELEKNGNYGDFCKVREIMGKSKFENELIDELNTAELGQVANSIQVLLAKSVKGNLKVRDAETANEQWWLNTFPCLEVSDSFESPMSVNTDKYGNTFVVVNFKVKGAIKQFHILQNGRVYTADTHKYTGKKVECAGTKTTVVGESVKKKTVSEQADLGNVDLVDRDSVTVSDDNNNNSNSNNNSRPSAPSYKDCVGTYQKGCKSDVIEKVQGCLNDDKKLNLDPKLVIDGKFGSKTKDALVQKGFSTFTDSDVEKICKTKLPDDEYVISADDEDTDDILKKN
jgi:hypothetical protein